MAKRVNFPDFKLKELKEKYEEEKLPMTKLASLYGISHPTIKKLLILAGAKLRLKPRKSKQTTVANTPYTIVGSA